MAKKKAKKVAKKATKKVRHKLGETFHAWGRKRFDGTFIPRTYPTKSEARYWATSSSDVVRVKFTEVK